MRVSDLQSKEKRAEKYDPSKLSSLETSCIDLIHRRRCGPEQTAGARSSETTSTYRPKQKTKRRLFGLLPGKGRQVRRTDWISSARPRSLLFIEAATQVRKGSHETGRLLFITTALDTYPTSALLAFAKPAIADSFYLEDTTSAPIQDGHAYQDIIFFPDINC